MFKLVLLNLIFPMVVSAYILPKGKNHVTYQGLYSTAEKLWKKKEDTPTRYGRRGKTRFLHHQLGYFRGITAKFQVRASLSYSQTKMKRGEEGGSLEGDQVNRLSGFGLGGDYLCLNREKLAIICGLSFRHPIYSGPTGDFSRSPDIFIAPNDGSIHYNGNLVVVYRLRDFVSLNLYVSYRLRSGEPKDQILADLFVPLFIGSKFSIGPGLNYLTTLGGVDIGTPGFVDQVGKRSGGNTKVKAFSIVKEVVLGGSIKANYQLSSKVDLNTLVNQKFSGRNTDKSTSFIFGFGYTF